MWGVPYHIKVYRSRVTIGWGNSSFDGVFSKEKFPPLVQTANELFDTCQHEVIEKYVWSGTNGFGPVKDYIAKHHKPDTITVERTREVDPLHEGTSVGKPELNGWSCDAAMAGVCLRPTARPPHGGEYEPGRFWRQGDSGDDYTCCDACYTALGSRQAQCAAEAKTVAELAVPLAAAKRAAAKQAAAKERKAAAEAERTAKEEAAKFGRYKGEPVGGAKAKALSPASKKAAEETAQAEVKAGLAASKAAVATNKAKAADEHLKAATAAAKAAVHQDGPLGAGGGSALPGWLSGGQAAADPLKGASVPSAIPAVETLKETPSTPLDAPDTMCTCM